MSGPRAATLNPEQLDEARLAGLPAGVHARVRRELRIDADGAVVEVRDRRGRRKLRSVWLYATTREAIAPSARELTFLLGAEQREWRTIVTTLGSGDSARAWSRACELVRGARSRSNAPSRACPSEPRVVGG